MNLYRRLHLSASTCPKFYGLPKIHKPNDPLRPIVASRGSTTYNLAQHLTKILKPLVSNTPHHVINSSSFIQEIKDLHLGPNDVLISFDLVSLFTNVPVDETCDIIKQKLLDDTSLHERTQLSVDEILDLLQLCLSNTCFQWKDTLYEQTSGDENDQYSLSFLDVTLTRQPDGTLQHSVHRKPTHTDRYLNYSPFITLQLNLPFVKPW